MQFLALFMLICTLCIGDAHAFIDFDNLNAPCDDSIGRNCGGNGQCVNGSCVCDNLWSKATDFVVFEDCATSFIGIWVLWAVNIVFLIWVYYKSTSVILLRFEVFFETKKTRKGYGLMQNKGLIAVIMYFGISTPFHLIMAILHFVQPATRVGFDILPTICFFFGKLGLYLAIFIVQSTMFATTLKGDRSKQSLVRLNTMFHAINSSLSILIGTFGFITLGAFQNEPGSQVQIMRAYYFCQGLTLLGNGTGCLIIKKMVNQALNRVQDISSGQRQESIRNKINELQDAGIKQGFLQGIIYVLMGSIPFFINKHGYFLPISWIAMPILGKKLAHQIMADKNAKTLMQRLGIKKTGTNSSSAHDPTSNTKNNDNTATGVKPGMTELAPTSLMESVNPSYAPSVNAYRKKKKIHEQQKSSFLSEGTLLEELLDPGHPLYKRFTKFVEERYAQNEVALLALCIQYKNASDSKERAKVGKQAVKEFIVADAPRAVDLPHDVKEILLSTAKRSQWVATSFDQIRRTLMFDLKGNFLAKFENQLEAEAQKVDPPTAAE